MDAPAQASPRPQGMGCPELGVFASETVEEPREMGRAALSLALNVSHWEVLFFFFPPSSSKLRIFLEFLKNLT